MVVVGSSQLAAWLAKLAAGLTKLAAGLTKLAAGLTKLAACLTKLGQWIVGSTGQARRARNTSSKHGHTNGLQMVVPSITCPCWKSSEYSVAQPASKALAAMVAS